MFIKYGLPAHFTSYSTEELGTSHMLKSCMIRDQSKNSYCTFTVDIALSLWHKWASKCNYKKVKISSA